MSAWSHAEAMQGWEAAEERESWARCDAEKWRALAQELAVTLNHFRGERCWYSNDDALIEKARKAGLEV